MNRIVKSRLQIYNKVLHDENCTKEMKTMCVINMIHEELISEEKAYELCEENLLFKNNWIIVDAKITELWEKYCR